MSETGAMRFKIYFLTIFLLKFISCHESESSEVGHIEITPYYDTLIFSDVIDIINDLNKNFKTPLDTFVNSDSESDENIEDLLSEYQHYLDKAHEQRRTYLEKLNQTKNKVPLLRRDSFVKTRLPTAGSKYNDYFKSTSYYNPPIYNIPPTTFNNPMDLFIPISPPMRFMGNPVHDSVYQKKGIDVFSRFDKVAGNKKPLTLPPSLRKPIEDPIKSPCFCPSNQLPCKCNCKQCLLPFSPFESNNNIPIKAQQPESIRKGFKGLFDSRIPEYPIGNMGNTANTINIKIKVDIQLPKQLEASGINNNQQYNRDSAVEYEDISKESISNIRLPTTSFNFPIPINMFGYNRPYTINKHDPSSIHKMTVHKKKKSRQYVNGNNSNKRHRKKLITFHNVKISPSQKTKPVSTNYNNLSASDNETTISNDVHQSNVTEKPTIKVESGNYTSTTSELPDIKNNTLEDSFYFTVNISNSNDNETEDIHKTGNSIELELTTPNMNTSNLREKRQVKNNSTVLKIQSNSTVNNSEIISAVTKTAKSVKKIDKMTLLGSELLYWPNSSENVTISQVKNITDIILEREHKKAKLNMSKEAIRHNRTMALEQAVFGQVDWNDVDTVVPAFISFVGKYINGILTFCSQHICHSMKCAEETCIHRTCLPEKRFNQIGHCSGSNKTDSVASMKSIMDLPSNVAFEVVDILQDRMFGKLYGKVTLCISSKCISFVTTKKMFKKSKCTAKTLNKIGHCPDIKKL